MEIRRLTLSNVRSYEHADVEFRSGTTLVSGDVGSGKTSLLYAIEMALFGFAEVEAAYLVRHRAAEAEVALTLEEGGHRFELRRRFVRKQRGGRELFEPQENSFSVDGSRSRYSATELRQRAIDLLGFPDNPSPRAHSDLWRWAVYVPQEMMREVLGQDPEERLETVRKALGLEQYRTAADNAQEVAAELRRRAETRAAEAERLSHWEAELPEWAERRSAAERRIREARTEEGRRRKATQAAEAELAELQGLRREADADRRELDRLVDELASLAGEVRGRETKIAHQRAEISVAEAEGSALGLTADRVPVERAALADLLALRVRAIAEQAEAELAVRGLIAADANRAALVARVQALERDLQQTAQSAQRSADELARLLNEFPTTEPGAAGLRTVEEIDAVRTRLQRAIDSLTGEQATAHRELSELVQLLEAGVCPRCRQPVLPDGFRPHQEEAAQAVSALAERLRNSIVERESLDRERGQREQFERARDLWQQVELRRKAAQSLTRDAELRVSQTKVEIDRLSREAGEVEMRSQELPRAQASVETIRSRLQDLEGRRAAVEQELRTLELTHERANTARARAEILAGELQRLETELVRERGRQTQLRARLSEIEPRVAAAAGLAEREGSVVGRLEESRRAVDAALSDLARTEQQHDEANRRVGEAERGSREKKSLDAESDHLKALSTWFGQTFREAVLKLERQRLSRAHQEFERGFARFFATLVEDPSLAARIDRHFGPYVEVDGEWTPPAALSGGERTALALAYRLALGGVVRSAGRLKLTTLILDEPTDGFSPEQVSRMGELLGELALPQVILVSHEAGLSAVADRVIRVRKSGGVSELVDERPAGSTVPGPAPPGTAPKRRRARVSRLDEPVPPSV